jgi:hypothetical protein
VWEEGIRKNEEVNGAQSISKFQISNCKWQIDFLEEG